MKEKTFRISRYATLSKNVSCKSFKKRSKCLFFRFYFQVVGLANTLVGAFIGVYGFIFLLQRTGHMVRNRDYLVGISDLTFPVFSQAL